MAAALIDANGVRRSWETAGQQRSPQAVGLGQLAAAAASPRGGSAPGPAGAGRRTRRGARRRPLRARRRPGPGTVPSSSSARTGGLLGRDGARARRRAMLSPARVDWSEHAGAVEPECAPKLVPPGSGKSSAPWTPRSPRGQRKRLGLGPAPGHLAGRAPRRRSTRTLSRAATAGNTTTAMTSSLLAMRSVCRVGEEEVAAQRRRRRRRQRRTSASGRRHTATASRRHSNRRASPMPRMERAGGGSRARRSRRSRATSPAAGAGAVRLTAGAAGREGGRPARRLVGRDDVDVDRAARGGSTRLITDPRIELGPARPAARAEDQLGGVLGAGEVDEGTWPTSAP